MLVKNVKIENSEELSDVRIRNGYICEITQNAAVREGETVLDGQNGLMLPPFVDSHVHLDTCLSLDKTGPNIPGTLFEGIRIWSAYRTQIDREEVQDRAMRTLRLYLDKGVQYIRSHVDISADLTALRALLELKEQVSDQAQIQIVAFPQDGICTSERVKENLEGSRPHGCGRGGRYSAF